MIRSTWFVFVYYVIVANCYDIPSCNIVFASMRMSAPPTSRRRYITLDACVTEIIRLVSLLSTKKDQFL